MDMSALVVPLTFGFDCPTVPRHGQGYWMYLYRADDRDRKTLDFMLSERRDAAAIGLEPGPTQHLNG